MSSPTGLERHPQVGRDRHHQRGQLLVDEAVAGPSFTRSRISRWRRAEHLNDCPRTPSRGVLIEMGCSWTRVGRVVSDLERSISGASRATVAVEATVSTSGSSVGRLLWSFSGRPAEQ
jgi:hypothetical protein